MKRSDIEKLLIILVVALVLEALFSSGLMLFRQYLISTEGSRMFSEGSLYNVVIYLQIFPNTILGLAIGYWLYAISTTKKPLWFLIGFLATWWSLAVFFLYNYSKQSTGENT